MTEDNLASRPNYPEISGLVSDPYGHPFGTVVKVDQRSDEITIKTLKGSFVTVSWVDMYYAGSGEYLLTSEIIIEDPVSPEPTGIQTVLAERGSRYGSFDTHAMITQALKDIFCGAVCDTNWSRLTPSQKEALDMTAHKIGRILNGDPNYADSWVDIVGYAQLVVNELEGE